jgi:hypothetical protein
MRERAQQLFFILSLLLLFSCDKDSETPVGKNETKKPTQTPTDPSTGDTTPPLPDPNPRRPGPTPPLPDPNPRRPIPPRAQIPRISGLRWYPNNKWDPRWSKAVISYAERENLNTVPINSSDLNLIGCPGYNKASVFEKNHFWTVFVASVSSQESAFNPKTRYWEAPLKEWSEGLLQLSVSNRKPSGGCSGINSSTIIQPIPNLRCGITILGRQLRGSARRGRPAGRLFPPRPYYWSTLTHPNKKPKVIAFFKRHLDQLSFCRN